MTGDKRATPLALMNSTAQQIRARLECAKILRWFLKSLTTQAGEVDRQSNYPSISSLNFRVDEVCCHSLSMFKRPQSSPGLELKALSKFSFQAETRSNLRGSLCAWW